MQLGRSKLNKPKKMKTSNFRLMIAVVAATACSTAIAIPITPVNVTMSLALSSSSVLVSDVSAQDIPGSGLDPATVATWLTSDVSFYNAKYAASYGAPGTVVLNDENLNSGPLLNVTAGEYLVLHYGKGTGGTGDGGGLVALYFDAAGTYQVPDNGSGPNGNGGISYAFGYSSGLSVPDGGSSLMLLGLAALGMFVFVRKTKTV
jgi:hypothetical protein